MAKIKLKALCRYANSMLNCGIRSFPGSCARRCELPVQQPMGLASKLDGARPPVAGQQRLRRGLRGQSRARARSTDMSVDIMFTLALCMTHREPATTMTISRPVQTKIPVLPRCPEPVPRCRK